MEPVCKQMAVFVSGWNPSDKKNPFFSLPSCKVSCKPAFTFKSTIRFDDRNGVDR